MLKSSVDYLVYNIIGLSHDLQISHILSFFIYDVIKLISLLFIFILILSFLRTYLPINKINKWMEKAKYGTSYLTAAIFGAITPFCSCSSIPIFLGFIKSGIPMGVGFSFLITSPIVNQYLLAIMIPFFGIKITILYALTGILIGTFAGMILGRFNLKEEIHSSFRSIEEIDKNCCSNFKERINFAIKESTDLIKKVWIWIIVAIGIGAIIHNYIPRESIELITNKTGIFSVPLATIIGVPMYGSCASIIPITYVLFEKGLSLGTVLAFAMSVSALSLPEAIILKKALSLKLIIAFFSIVTFGIILIGYIFNALQYIL